MSEPDIIGQAVLLGLIIVLGSFMINQMLLTNGFYDEDIYNDCLERKLNFEPGMHACVATSKCNCSMVGNWYKYCELPRLDTNHEFCFDDIGGN